MMVNGEPRLTCSAFLREWYPNLIRVEPLTHFPVIRDLVVAIDDFLRKLPTVQPWLVRAEQQDVTDGEFRQTPEQLDEYKQFSMCINCMLCYAACPVYALEPSFIGPAAIALAQRYNLDSRDGAQAARGEVIYSHEGIWDCTVVGDCSRVCPKHVDPSAAIQQAKVANTLDWYKSILMPGGRK
jgi:fumarate reductase iron-sulfur subunit